jgi:hypothetical protein
LICARHNSVTRSRPAAAQTPNLNAPGEEDGDEEVDAGAGGAGGGDDEEEGIDDDHDEADANVAGGAVGAAGGEDSPEPFDAAMALLRRRLLRGEGDVELGPALQRNYRRACHAARFKGVPARARAAPR